MSDLAQAEGMLSVGANTYDLDDSTKRLLEERKKRLNTPTTEELLGVIGTPGQGLMTPTPAYDFSASLGGDSAAQGQAVTDAISRRNVDRSTDYINNLKSNLKMTQPVRDAGNLKQLGQNMARESEVALNNHRIKKQWDLDRKRLELYKQQQKDGVLASVLGVVGAVAGTALGVMTGGAGFAAMAGMGLAKGASELGKAQGNASAGMSSYGKDMGSSTKGPSLFK
jgi:hypothetical protein